MYSTHATKEEKHIRAGTSCEVPNSYCNVFISHIVKNFLEPNQIWLLYFPRKHLSMCIHIWNLEILVHFN